MRCLANSEDQTDINGDDHGDVVLGNDVITGADSFIAKETRLNDGVTVGTGVTVEKTVVIDEGTSIGDNTLIKKDIVVGANVTIGARAIRNQCPGLSRSEWSRGTLQGAPDHTDCNPWITMATGWCLNRMELMARAFWSEAMP